MCVAVWKFVHVHAVLTESEGGTGSPGVEVIEF